jgi:hypothetical protein
MIPPLWARASLRRPSSRPWANQTAVSAPVSFDLAAAVSQNRVWASTKSQVRHGPKRLSWPGQGWGPLYGAIAAWIFGQYDPAPTPEQFAHLVAHWQRGQEGVAANGILGRGSWNRVQAAAARGIPAEFVSPVAGLERPHGLEQVAAVFGDPRTMSQAEWESRYVGAARAPGPRRFLLSDGSQSPVVYLHRSLVPHAEAFFAAVARGGLWDELVPMGRAYKWDPKGESLHAWGIAMDLRPERYQPAARARDYPDAEHYPPGYLVRHIQAYGWQWGLWFETPQPGHLQYATGVETSSGQ